MGRDLGDLGESILPNWAAQVGLICNPSRKDRAGWDYILESPNTYRIAAAAGNPLDVASTVLQCLVQVKATDKRDTSIPIKLSNWDRLVKSPLPAFVLVLEFDRELQPQRAFLVHVGEVWISRVLRRERELGSVAAKDLHKKSLSLSYSDSPPLAALTGQALWDTIQEAVGDPARYHQHKRHWVRTVGYEGYPPLFQGRLTLQLPPGQSAAEALVDFSLGIIPTAAARDLMKVDMRFGIAAPPARLDRVGNDVAVAAILGEGDDAVMSLRTGDPRFDATLLLKMHLPPMGALDLEPRFAKLRLLGKGIDVQLPASGGTGKLRLTLPKRYINQRLAELRPLARLIQAIAYVRDVGRELDFTLSVNNHVSTGRFGVQNLNFDLEPLAAGVLQAYAIADKCQIHGAQATLDSLSSQKHAIELAHSLLCGSEIWIRAEVDARVAEETGPVVVLPQVLTLELGPHRLYFAFAVYGELSSVGGERGSCTIQSKGARLLEQEVRMAEHDPAATASAMIARAADKLRSFQGTRVVPSNPERPL